MIPAMNKLSRAGRRCAQYCARARLAGAKAGFTLIEILMAMFIMALGVVGVMSLFPVGLESVRTAMDATMTDIIGRTGVAQMQCYMNASEIFDVGTGGQSPTGWIGSVWTRARPPCRACMVDWVSTDMKSLRFWRMLHCWISSGHNVNGYYMRFVWGGGQGQIRRIDTGVNNQVSVAGDSDLAILNHLPWDVVRNGSKLIITRYGFPVQWRPLRLAMVGSLMGSSITPTGMNGKRDQLADAGWEGDTWRGDYYILFTSGRGQGRLLRASGGINSISVRTGPVDLKNDDGVQEGDTFVILGTEDVKPCTFPGNMSNRAGFNETQFDQRFQTPPTVPYYTTNVDLDIKSKNLDKTQEVQLAEYSYLCIISSANAPRPQIPDIGSAKTARIDVVVFRNYSPDTSDKSCLTWLPLEQQPRAVGFYTGFISPL